METHKIFNGKKYELMEGRISKESAEIVAKRFKSNGAKVRITKDIPSKSYNVWARGEGESWYL